LEKSTLHIQKHKYRVRGEFNKTPKYNTHVLAIILKY
jgi:hypothetical protein